MVPANHSDHTGGGHFSYRSYRAHAGFSDDGGNSWTLGGVAGPATNESATWPWGKLIYAGSAAYSSMVVLPDGRVGILFERDRYARISFAAFSLEELIASSAGNGPA